MYMNLERYYKKRVEAILLFYKKRSERNPDMKPTDRSQGTAHLPYSIDPTNF